MRLVINVVSMNELQLWLIVSFLVSAKGMETADEELNKINRRYKKLRHHNNSLSFSASLPDDVHGVFADSICAVKYSINPYEDLRESIVEMIREVGVRDWEEMEELVYCYVVLNPPEIHGFIGAAFLSLCSQDFLLVTAT
ncbi:transcription repressor OFP2-like [Macadamia integrifolia]|uniref:transcription repressor OFP2-like n=1 Tax=Macadamia integrifolia TaxID=60698 RepID=UPI001C4EFD2E|nr:transcription repressor OFP2-like [Macadamia integrifolia]